MLFDAVPKNVWLVFWKKTERESAFSKVANVMVNHLKALFQTHDDGFRL